MNNYLQEKVSRESLVTMFSQAPVAMALLRGEKMVIETANRQILELWGKDESVIGKEILDALPEIRGQKFPEILLQVFKTGETYYGFEELALLTHEGVTRESYFDFIYAPVVDGTKIVGVSVVAVDATSKVQSKKKLSESEARFKHLILNADVSTAFYTGEDLIIDTANDMMLKTWGKGPEVIGMKLEDALPELQGQPFIDILKDVYATGKTYKAQEDKVLLEVDGKLQTFYFNFSYKAMRDGDNNIFGILNMAVDVTELVKSREELRQSQLKFKNLADSMPQIVWTARPDGYLDYYNEKWYEFTGFRRDVFGDESWANIFLPEDLKRVNRIWKEAVQTGTNYEIEYRFLDKDNPGQYRWFLGRAVPIRDEEGNIVQWIGTNTDIHEFKVLEKQKDDFLGIASHELKTPLTSIKLYAQLLERLLTKEGNNKAAEYARKVESQINRLNMLVADLLDVTKMQNGKMQLSKTTFDFNEMIREVVEEMQVSTASHKLQLHLGDVGAVHCDRERISQVVSNLVTNAIKYSPESETVNISTQINSSNEVELCVQDFGIGMPQEKVGRVFEQFYRVSGDEQYTFPGLGLGLYIASEIIERSGGKIWVNSVLGKGSTFCFSIPRG